MKYVAAPDFDDEDMLEKMSNNKRLSSYPDLERFKDQVLLQYQCYLRARGDALKLMPSLNVTDKLKNGLISHYYSEIEGLEIIEYIRNKLSPRVCPMCGGQHPTTVDHFIPKDKYPEYAVFTKNLVPACACNSKRGGDDFKGEGRGQRVLHPYFDSALSEVRIIEAKVEPPFESPKIELLVCCQGHECEVAVEYHLRTILEKTNVINVLEQEWRSLIRFYDDIFDIDQGDNITEDLINRKLKKLLKKQDRISETPNNWNSMLFSGILNSPGAVEFLTKKIGEFQSGQASPEDF